MLIPLTLLIDFDFDFNTWEGVNDDKIIAGYSPEQMAPMTTVAIIIAIENGFVQKSISIFFPIKASNQGIDNWTMVTAITRPIKLNKMDSNKY